MAEGILKEFSLPVTSHKLEEAVRRWGLHGRLFSVAWGQQLEKYLERKDFLDDLCPFIQVDEGPIEIPVVFCVAYTSNVLDSVGETILEALNPKYEEVCLKTVKTLRLSHETRARNFSELGLNHVGRYEKRWYTYYCALEVLHKEYSDNNVALLEQPKLDQNQIMELLSRLKPKEIEATVRHMIEPSRLKESVFTDLLRKILGTIYRAIEKISSPSSPIANLCLDELMKLRAVLQSEAMDASTVVAKAVAYAKLGGFSGDKDADAVLLDAQGVLDKYLQEAYMYLSIPAVLNPRFKLEYVTIVFKEVFGSEAAAYTSRVKNRIEDIFDEHRRKRRSFDGEGTSRIAAGEGPLTEAVDMDGHSQEGITELERYLTDDLVPGEEGEGFDVLMWWKANSRKYPTVASMARDALAMPASDLLSPEHMARIRSMLRNYCVTYPEAQSDDH
uniref:HAT C-terminal dimerisation domain-containing protein n=1 Tax=Arundo donax TaxID=35708 RepID=A0A0A8Y0W8_ARUDO